MEINCHFCDYEFEVELWLNIICPKCKSEDMFWDSYLIYDDEGFIIDEENFVNS